MDSTLAWVIVAAIVIIGVLGWIMGPRLRKARLTLGKNFSGEVEGTSAGPSVARAQAYGQDNRITADGDGARVEDASAVGTGNVIGAGTGGTPKKPSR
jgi:hypothetical protein